MKITTTLFMVSLIMVSKLSISFAEEIKFSVGGGSPFHIIPEISYSIKGSNYRWYANYKKGEVDGFSIGFERGLGVDQKHAVGMLIGTIGSREQFVITNTNGNILVNFNQDDKTQGFGLSYSFNFNGLNKTGMKVRFVLGYGEGDKRNSKRVDGSLNLSYQF